MNWRQEHGHGQNEPGHGTNVLGHGQRKTSRKFLRELFFLKGNYEFKIFFFENFPREPGHGQNGNSLLKKTNVLGHGQNKCLSFF